MATADEYKGRMKEAAGDLTDDSDLKREGKMDQAEGKAKRFVDRTRDKAGEVAERVKRTASDER